MATAGGFSFGSAAATGTSGLFGAKTTTSLTTPSFSFGATTTTGTSTSSFSFGSTASAVKQPFGATTSVATTAPGFSFGSSAATAASGPSATGLFSGFSKPATTTSSVGLFGANPTATAATGLFAATSTAASTSVLQTKALETPKEAMVPTELSSLVTDLETHIKSQKDVKEEISKISTEGIATTREEISILKQSIALIANSLQRDSVAVENLKLEVGQELKNAEIAQRIRDISVGLHHDFAAPMEYFQRLVHSFESRINLYRREIEELETCISSSISLYQFTPQDLSNVLRRLNDSFIGLASELQQVHESVKVIKEKYLHFRRVMFNDCYDPFIARKKLDGVKGKGSLVGPSPFPVVQGAGMMALAFKTEAKTSNIDFNNLSGLSSTFAKPAGLTRSLSFGGSAAKPTFGGFGTGFGGGSSLFDKTSAGNTSSLSFGTTSTAVTPFTLQKPPCGKRGKLF